MKLLAIETSCEHASVALYVNGSIEQRLLEGHANHSEKVLAIIDALLKESDVAVSGLNAVAFGSGPGAFTGLRLACGVAQGLALGAGIGVVPICSLDALALQSGKKRVLVATDARMNEVYWQTCTIEEGAVRATTAITCSPPESLILTGDNWFGIGSAFKAYGDVLQRGLGPQLEDVDSEAVPQAREIALLAVEHIKLEKILPPEMAVPLYVRDKVALTTQERLARGGKA